LITGAFFGPKCDDNREKLHNYNINTFIASLRNNLKNKLVAKLAQISFPEIIQNDLNKLTKN